MATNCFVIAPGRSEQCVIVDPGIGVRGQLDEVISAHSLHPVAVLLTHGHIDHTFSVIPVCEARDVPAYIHPSDRGQLTDPWTPLGMRKGVAMFGNLAVTVGEPSDVIELADGDDVSIAGLDFTVRHAPGHTPGSVVFQLADSLFAGDVVFAGSVGRTDLPGGSFADLEDSLRRVILPLPDETVIYPGHGPNTTVGRERGSNPFLQGLDAGDRPDLRRTGL